MNSTKGLARIPKATTNDKQNGQNYILAIGINDYDHCPKLINAVKDVEDFTQLMISRYGYNPDNIKLLRDKEATYKKIFSELKRLVTLVRPSDSVLIYFSGHGEMDELLDEGYWIPVEAKHESINQYIANSTIQKILNKINSFHTFLIVDSCYSGSLFLDGKTRFISDAYDFPSRWGLTSGRNTIVSDGKAGENSPFAKALIETLTLLDTPLNSSALCDVIKQSVAASTDKNQLPVGDPLSINGHKGGQFVFYPVVQTAKTEEDLSIFEEVDTIEEALAFMRNFPNSDLRQAALLKLENMLATPLLHAVIGSETPPEAVSDDTVTPTVDAPTPPVVEIPITVIEEKVAATPSVQPAPIVSLDTHFDCEPELVFVAGGTFQMGSSSGEAREKPIHAVTLDDFYIGKFVVTQKEWDSLMHYNPSHFKGGERFPVENISWQDTQEFIKRLNEKTGKNYRLPTEAEWEYAARGGQLSQGFKYSGSNTLDDVAWYDNNSGRRIHAVGEKKPNELGLYDMSGNVWEWCSDKFGSYTKEAVTNPQGTTEGTYHINRGGSWNFAAYYCRTKYRCYDPANNVFNGLGFRLAMSKP